MQTTTQTTTENAAAIAAENTAAKPAKAAKAAKPSKAKPAAKAAKPVKAKPDNSARVAAIATDRASLRALYATFEASRASIPVKPLSAFKPVAVTAHPIARRASARQAAAIALAFAAAGKQLKPGAAAPRIFQHAGSPCAIENGALRDAISSGLCTVTGDAGADQRIVLSAAAPKAIAALIGAKAMQAGKLTAA